MSWLVAPEITASVSNVHGKDRPRTQLSLTDPSDSRHLPSLHDTRSAAQPHDRDESLDLRPTNTAFLLGDTGEADPYLLKHSSLAVQAENMSFRRIYRDGYAPNDPEHSMDNGRPLIFMLGAHRLYDRYEPRFEDDILRNAQVELEKICSDRIGVRLVKLYFKYVYPYFPVLSRSQMLLSDSGMTDLVRALPLSLKAALYATAQPFMIYDDYLSTILDLAQPSASTLYRISWIALTHEMHTPHLSTLQACLLFLQRVNDSKYVMDSPFRWSFVAWTVSLAQSLGLSSDCSTWRGIPAWEKRLRRRLWWATYVMDKWSLPSAGLSSHIKLEDYDVLPLTSLDFASDMERSSPGGQILDDLHKTSHFHHLVELSRILSDIHDAFFTIRGSKIVAGDFALTLELAKPLRTRVHKWKESFDAFTLQQQTLSGRQTRLDGNSSLRLAYPVATMILFRALLRPLESSSGSAEDIQMRDAGRDSVRVGAKACCVEIVQFLEQIKPGVWNAFWHSCKEASSLVMQHSAVVLTLHSFPRQLCYSFVLHDEALRHLDFCQGDRGTERPHHTLEVGNEDWEWKRR